MENCSADHAALRLQLLDFSNALKVLQRKREEFWKLKLELETLEEVIHRDAIDLLDRLEEMGCLEPHPRSAVARTVLFIPSIHQ